MLDINFIREHKDLVIAGAKKKHVDVDIEKLLELDEKRRQLQAKLDQARAEQNLANRDAVNSDDKDKETFISEMKEKKVLVKSLEKDLAEVMKEWQALMLVVPNVPDMSVPEGTDDADNKEIKKWGEIPEFDFTPKSHVELLQNIGGLDLERGSKVSGFRGYFLKGDGARLNYAVWRFLMDFFDKEKTDFTPLMAPSLVRRESLMGTGYLPQGEEDLYKTQDGDYLAGTAEVATMAYRMGEILEEHDLPMKFISFSPCFRREAGSHGKDTKGIMRVHEFFKFEQLVLCEASHEKSVELHEEITKNAEEMLQRLEIPYRMVINCGGDLGLGQVKKYDIEAWVPSEDKYRETHSASYFHDFQTRRLNIRYKNGEGKTLFPHSLNNTAIATPRILISIVENNQNADGTINVPKALVPYIGKEVLGV